MRPDEDLLQRVRRIRESQREKLGLDWLLEQYEAHCDLSRGPDKNRSEHHQSQAVQVERQIRRIVTRHEKRTTKKPTTPDKGKK